MTSLDVIDLIGIPYKAHGRYKDGMDCYGVAIEVERRLGKDLRDVDYTSTDKYLADENLPTLNVKPTEEIKVGTILEMTLKNELHIGVVVSKSTFIHATINQGVRISRIGAVPITAMYEVD